MNPAISECAFAKTIERALLQHDVDARPDNARMGWESSLTGKSGLTCSYISQRPVDYDHRLCLIGRCVLDRLLSNQPKNGNGTSSTVVSISLCGSSGGSRARLADGSRLT